MGRGRCGEGKAECGQVRHGGEAVVAGVWARVAVSLNESATASGGGYWGGSAEGQLSQTLG